MSRGDWKKMAGFKNAYNGLLKLILYFLKCKHTLQWSTLKGAKDFEGYSITLASQPINFNGFSRQYLKNTVIIYPGVTFSINFRIA
jgi:hypothetical protein